jgi:hypothetical protein
MPSHRSCTGSAILSLALLASPCLFAATRSPGPRLWIWAWDRPEDLRFLKPEEAGVAFFVLGLHVHRVGMDVRPRTAPLRLAEGMHRLAVVRLEVDLASLPEDRLGLIVAAIQDQGMVPGIEALQLDFDATRCQRPLYRKLLGRLRAALGDRIPITITALASWCMGDRWLRDLPVAGAVAMLFQMGPDSAEALTWLRRGRPLAGVAKTPPDWGLGLEQPLPVSPPAGARTFLFSNHPWTLAAFRRAQRRVNP